VRSHDGAGGGDCLLRLLVAEQHRGDQGSTSACPCVPFRRRRPFLRQNSCRNSAIAPRNSVAARALASTTAIDGIKLPRGVAWVGPPGYMDSGTIKGGFGADRRHKTAHGDASVRRIAALGAGHGKADTNAR
jgi:hypothetical protein